MRTNEKFRKAQSVVNVCLLLQKARRDAITQLKWKKNERTQAPELVAFVKDMGGILNMRFTKKKQWVLKLTNRNRIFEVKHKDLEKALITLMSKFANYERFSYNRPLKTNSHIF